MVIGYIRVSTEQQDVRNQRHEILEYANQHKLHISEFIEIEISSRKDLKARGIEELLAGLKKGDTLIVSELSREHRDIYEFEAEVGGRPGEASVFMLSDLKKGWLLKINRTLSVGHIRERNKEKKPRLVYLSAKVFYQKIKRYAINGRRERNS